MSMPPVATPPALVYLPPGLGQAKVPMPPRRLTRDAAPAFGAHRPRVRVVIHDRSQRAIEVAPNAFRVRGITRRIEALKPSASIEIDGRRLLILLGPGMAPLDTAHAISDALPQGYRAVIEPPHELAGPVVVTIVHEPLIRAAAA